MRGKTIHRWLARLSQKEALALRDWLLRDVDGKLLTKLLDHLRQATEYKESPILLQLRISMVQKNHLLQRLWDLLVSFMGAESTSVKLQMLYEAARHDLNEVQFESAIDLIQHGILAAATAEHFQLVMDFWRLLDYIPEPPEITGMSHDAAHAERDKISELVKLEKRMRATRMIADDAARASAIVEIGQHQVLANVDDIASFQGKLHFWKLKTWLAMFVGDLVQAIEPQTQLIALMEGNKDFMHHQQHLLVKELGDLRILLIETGNGILADGITFKIDSFPEVTKLVQREKFKQLYPFRLATALLMGDAALATQYATDILRQIDAEKDFLTKDMITQNLVYCTFYHFVIGDFRGASRMLVRLRRFQKQEIPAGAYIFSRCLEILLAFEENDLDDARRHIKLLSRAKLPIVSPGLPEILDFLQSLTNSVAKSPRGWKTYQVSESNLAAASKLKEYAKIDDFEIHTWLLAKAQKCPMIEIFHHRAASQT